MRAALAQRMVLSGEGLSASAVQWGNREVSAPAVRLTDRDLRLMALLHDVNFLSASQLLVLGWGDSGMRVGQKRLKRLHDSEYLDRFRPVLQTGTAEWNYRLSSLGWSALTERGGAPRNAAYTPTAITSISYTEHDLQTAALVLRIAQEAAHKRGGGLIDRMPFTWKGPRSGRIDTDTTEEFERSPAAKLSKGTRLHPEGSRQGYLEPDATLVARSGDDLWAVLIEYDRTERPHKQIDRLRRYEHWLLSGWRESHFATHSIPPSVVFLTARERPLRRLIETADKTFAAWHGNEHAGPREGTHPARQRVVFTSRERVLAGDWTMQRTPSLPPALRDDPAVCSPRSLEYNLASLFAGAEVGASA
jgi:Replication-relaxation